MGATKSHLTSRRSVLAGLLVAGGLSGCGGAREFRYRFGIDLEVEGRPIQGVVVQAYRYRPSTGKAGMDVGEARTIGEALILDLGQHGLLVATLAAQLARLPGRVPIASGRWTPAQAISEQGADQAGMVRKDLEVGFFQTLTQRGRVEIASSELPILVTFGDSKAPETVRALDPKNLSSGLGPGVRLVRAWVEATNQGLTRGRVHAFFPWAKVRPGAVRFFSGGVGMRRTLADTLSNQDLIGI